MIKKYKLIKNIKNIIICTLSILLIFLIRTCIVSSTFKSNPKIMKVHFINVGQGDSILIQVNNKNLIIDSGPKDNKNNLLKYLNKLNIASFDYVIATHPHEDHIGNMAYLINNYKIYNFYAPKVLSTTTSFETMIEALVRKNLKINIIKANIDTIDLGQDTLVEVFSPNLDTYENLNNYSPIIKITYKNTSFLFTGDAEKLVENEVLNKNIKSDVLKVGHHGSSTSSSLDFIKTVSPSISVISVGKYNSYNHPNTNTLETLKNTIIYRTDLNNNIIIESDGINLKTSFK